MSARREAPSVGVDCTDVARWRGMLRELKSGSARRLFTEREHRHCRSFADPAPHYAARWCAKEAVFKALSPLAPADLRRIEIVSDRDGRPRAVLPKSAKLKGIVLSLSLSHTPTMAVAAAVALRRGVRRRLSRGR